MSCEIKTPEMGVDCMLFLRNEKLVIWKLKASRFRKGKYEVDRLYRLTGANPS